MVPYTPLVKGLALKLQRRHAPHALLGCTSTLRQSGAAAALGGHQRASGQRADVAVQVASIIVVNVRRRVADVTAVIVSLIRLRRNTVSGLLENGLLKRGPGSSRFKDEVRARLG